jgi:prevent-host-death family protein
VYGVAVALKAGQCRSIGMKSRRITAQQLHRETRRVLDIVEGGVPVIITKLGRTIARLKPIAESQSLQWDDMMADVWKAQRQVRARDVVKNPVLAELRRRRR